MRYVVCSLAALMVAAPVSRSATAQAVRTQDVAFVSGPLRLAGTLFQPAGARRAPAVVLIHGSGKTDRASMRFFAETFARAGVAALAYDKRGVGKSEGPEFAWRDFSFSDLADDAAAAVRYLRGRPDIDSTRIGIFGASQGGWVAPLAAANAGGVAFMVLVSASVSTLAEDNVFEREARLRKEGFSSDEIAEVTAMHMVDIDVSRTGQGFDAFSQLWEQNKSKRWFRRVYTGDGPAAADGPYRTWYRTVLDFSAEPVLGSLSMPALWLYGDPALDRLCPVSLSMKRLEALRSQGKPYTIRSFPGADHSLQMPEGDAPIETALRAWLATVLSR